jgi:hypothetical protein
MSLQNLKFVVNEKPYCVWDFDLKNKNREFIQNFEVNHFEFLSNLFENLWNNEEDDNNKQALSIEIRRSYSLALETFFSILGAALQAPDCIPGYLAKYRLSDLRNLVKRIYNSEKFLSRFDLENFDFISISKFIHFIEIDDEKKLNQIVEQYGILWKRFAQDFLDDKLSKEYNSMKHGFRTKSGGFSVSIGKQKPPNKSADPKDMKSFGGSTYGAQYFLDENYDKSGMNFTLSINLQNWNPENFINGLQLISFSLNNIFSFLKQFENFCSGETKYIVPSDLSGFDAPWKIPIPAANVAIKEKFDSKCIKLCSKDDILKNMKIKYTRT